MNHVIDEPLHLGLMGDHDELADFHPIEHVPHPLELGPTEPIRGFIQDEQVLRLNILLLVVL